MAPYGGPFPRILPEGLLGHEVLKEKADGKSVCSPMHSVVAPDCKCFRKKQGPQGQGRSQCPQPYHGRGNRLRREDNVP